MKKERLKKGDVVVEHHDHRVGEVIMTHRAEGNVTLLMRDGSRVKYPEKWCSKYKPLTWQENSKHTKKK